MKAFIAGLLALAGSATAQQPAWGQCGGRDWTGPTTCVSGYVCQYSNEWYSQCVPGTATTVTTTTRPATTTTTTSTRPPTSTSNPPPSSYVTTSGTRFRFDGVTKYFAGTNCYWCSVGGISDADVDLTMNHIQQSGLKILRVWGFNDVTSIPSGNQIWFQNLAASGSTINTGATGLQRLDYVVQAAEKRGIKLIIPFVNNWDDYGGYAAYVRAFGGSKTSWYTNTAAQAQYRRFIQAVVSRYKTSTAILAWELANEPRCAGCSTDIIYNWARDTSAYVKSLDSNHLVTLGDEGFGLAGDGSYPYQFGEGLDFVKNLGISTLDFGTFHMYPDHWGTTIDWGNGWIKSHADACRAAGKPCLLEEYGALGNHCTLERPWQLTSVAAAGMAGDAFWQHGDTLSYGNTHDDGYAKYYGSADWKCLVDDHVKAIG